MRYIHHTCVLRAFVARGRWDDLTCANCKHFYEGNVGVHVAQLALEQVEAVSGQTHQLVACALVNLANAYGRAGNEQREREILEVALGLFEAEYGPDHPVVAMVLVSLGAAVGELGDLPRQMELLTRALAIQEREQGPEHREVAATLVNLSNAHSRLGDAATAKSLLERALGIKEREFGANHTEVASTLTNLSVAYFQLGDLERFQELLERALAIQEREYGPDHRQVAAILMNLGNAVGQLGDRVREKELLERALAIQEREFGPSHREVAVTLANLARVHGQLGNSVRQAALLQMAVDIQEREFGPEHRELGPTLASLGSAYGVLGHTAKQVENLQRALLIQEREFGPENRKILPVLSHLGRALLNLAETLGPEGFGAKKAEHLLLRTLYIQVQALGAASPEACTTRASAERARVLSDAQELDAKKSLARALFLRDQDAFSSAAKRARQLGVDPNELHRVLDLTLEEMRSHPETGDFAEGLQRQSGPTSGSNALHLELGDANKLSLSCGRRVGEAQPSDAGARETNAGSVPPFVPPERVPDQDPSEPRPDLPGPSSSASPRPAQQAEASGRHSPVSGPQVTGDAMELE